MSQRALETEKQQQRSAEAERLARAAQLEEEAKQLEEEARKRRERIRAWQEAKSKQQIEEEVPPAEEPAAGWSLDDDMEDEEGEEKFEEDASAEQQENSTNSTSLVPEDDEEDPLDAYMKGLYNNEGVVIAETVGVGGSGWTEEENKRKGTDETSPPVAQRPPQLHWQPNYGSSDAETGGVLAEMLQYNTYGSNYVTTEDILSGLSARDASAGGEWETDLGEDTEDNGNDANDSASELAADEDQAERDRKEFLAAIHKAQEAMLAAETRHLHRLEKEEASLGRVFAGEGDMVEETEIAAKKKSALDMLEEAKRGKELKPVDHKAMNYLPFRKNLYIVPKSLSKLSDSEVRARRQTLQIKVRGKGCPAPVENWEQCGLAERILTVIEKHQFEAPFAIQKQAIPAIMCGRDVIGVAKTGSGKTLAFLLPMFRHIMDQPPLGDGEGPIGLVMAPARELAFQIYNEAKRFSKALGIRVACIYGGTGVAEQIAELKRGADIVVCTPGRLIDILCMQAGRLMSLKRVTMVVMDEADRMFDMGFEPQIKMIIQAIRPDRQTVLFSATFPKQIEKLAKTVLRLPLEIVVGERSTVNKDITQYVEVHDESDKFMRLLQLLGVWYERGSVLVFVDKQEKCDALFQELLKAGYPCLSLHGGKEQVDRDYTLHEFKTQIKTVLVATSVAGRGLDVPEICVVINYCCPNHIEDYVHRVGRTGRAGRKGTAYTFITPSEDQYAPLLVAALEKAGQEVPEELVELTELFKDKVRRGEAQWSTSGFVGKGFTFDASEMNEAQKLASMQRRAYEIEQGMVYDREDEDADNEFEDEGLLMLEDGDENDEVSSVTSYNTMSTGTADASALKSDASGGRDSSVTAGGAGSIFASDAASAVERARALASSLKGTLSSTAPLGSDGKVDAKAALARAKLIALQKGGAVGGSGDGDEATTAYSDELEINDYPAPVMLC